MLEKPARSSHKLHLTPHTGGMKGGDSFLTCTPHLKGPFRDQLGDGREVKNSNRSYDCTELCEQAIKYEVCAYIEVTA